MANDKVLDYELANCRDMETELFYFAESELQENGVALKTLRKLCFECPIQDSCARYAFKYEKYGMWGGFTEKERALMYRGKWNNPELIRMFKQLQDLGVSLAICWDYAQINPQHLDAKGMGEGDGE